MNNTLKTFERDLSTIEVEVSDLRERLNELLSPNEQLDITNIMVPRALTQSEMMQAYALVYGPVVRISEVAHFLVEQGLIAASSPQSNLINVIKRSPEMWERVRKGAYRLNTEVVNPALSAQVVNSESISPFSLGKGRVETLVDKCNTHEQLAQVFAQEVGGEVQIGEVALFIRNFGRSKATQTALKNSLSATFRKSDEWTRVGRGRYRFVSA